MSTLDAPMGPNRRPTETRTLVLKSGWFKIATVSVGVIIWSVSFGWWAISLHASAMASINANTKSVMALGVEFSRHIDRPGHAGMERDQAALKAEIAARLANIETQQMEQRTDTREMRRVLQEVAARVR